MAKETSIVDIFNRMSYNDGEAENTDDKKIRELYPDLENINITGSYHTTIELLETSPRIVEGKETRHLRALLLLDLARKLSEEANKLSQLQDFRKKDYNLLIDYFNYYSNICYQIKKIQAYDEVLIVLGTDVPYFILGSVISSAFAAGCPVTVAYFKQKPWFLLFLKQVFSRVRDPEGFFTLVPYDNVNSVSFDTQEAKIVFLGNLARNVHERSTWSSASFVSPNKTATIIFEFCDLSAAIDKIINETWNRKLATMWGVSTAVVQESVYRKFLEKLKLRLDQLIDGQESVAIKNRIISEEDQNQEIELNVQRLPVLKVLSCRTANEGVNLLNSYKDHLGTSIWSENSSQALEVASKLICQNIWINCHGIIEPSVPFQPSGRGGSGVFGGYEGVLEYATLPTNLSFGKKYSLCCLEKKEVEETVLSAQKAFEKWLETENKGMYLTKIAKSLKDHRELSSVHDVIITVMEKGNRKEVLPRRCNKNFYIIQENFPIGVIAIQFRTIKDLDLNGFVYLITIAIALGNAVVLAMGERKDPLVRTLVEIFINHLPPGLLSVIDRGEESGVLILLASNTIIQALWLGGVNDILTDNLKLIKSRSLDTFKRVWFIPDLCECVPANSFIFQRECLKNKIIWLPKVDQFP